MSTRNGTLRNDVGTRIRNGAAMRSAHRRWTFAAVIALARTCSLAGFEPAAPVQAGRRTLLSFTIEQPSGQPLTGPQEMLRTARGRRSDHRPQRRQPRPIRRQRHRRRRKDHPALRVPAPGRYRIVISAYPSREQPAVPEQLPAVHHRARPRPLPAATDTPRFSATEVVDGYRFQIQGAPHLHAIQGRASSR